MRFSLPYGGTDRIRFIGYDLSRPSRHPRFVYVSRNGRARYFSTSRTSYSFGQYLPVR